MAAGDAAVTFSVARSDGDAAVGLTSPSGIVITPSSLPGNVTHHADATLEVYSVAGPEAGRWNVLVSDPALARGGTATVFLRAVQTARRHVTPIASIVWTPGLLAGSVTFDGTSSAAGDGAPLRSYAWDFGDGTTAQGAVVPHTFVSSAIFTVLLTVTDDAGAVGYVSASVPIPQGGL